MALSTEMRGVMELLMNELLARKESFRAIFTKMMPIVHYENEFFVAFFLGYLAHSYKQVFSLLTNRDMQYDEINEALELLMRNESKIREALVGRQVPKEEIERVPKEEIERVPKEEIERVPKEEIERVPKEEIERVPKEEERIKPVETRIEKVNALELNVDEIRRMINIIKEATKEKIIKYEVNLAKSGKFKKSVLR